MGAKWKGNIRFSRILEGDRVDEEARSQVLFLIKAGIRGTSAVVSHATLWAHDQKEDVRETDGGERGGQGCQHDHQLLHRQGKYQDFFKK